MPSSTPHIDILLQGLNPQQTEAALRMEGETLVIAGAGSGKTAVLTRRVAHLIAQGEEAGSILCLTFTNKAAREMNERLHTLLHTLGINTIQNPSWNQQHNPYSPLLCTFHSLGVRIVREFGESIGIHKGFSILDFDDQEKIIKNLLKEANLDPKNYPPKTILSCIALCKQELLSPEESKRVSRDFPDVVHSLYKKYTSSLRATHSVDFDDLLFLPYTLLNSNESVRTLLQNRWRHIMVDEFQDTNHAQFRIVELLYGAE